MHKGKTHFLLCREEKWETWEGEAGFLILVSKWCLRFEFPPIALHEIFRNSICCTVRPFMMELLLSLRFDGSEDAAKFQGFCMVDWNLTGLLRFSTADLNFYWLIRLCTLFLSFQALCYASILYFLSHFTMASLRFIWFRLLDERYVVKVLQ